MRYIFWLMGAKFIEKNMITCTAPTIGGNLACLCRSLRDLFTKCHLDSRIVKGSASIFRGRQHALSEVGTTLKRETGVCVKAPYSKLLSMEVASIVVWVSWGHCKV